MMDIYAIKCSCGTNPDIDTIIYAKDMKAVCCDLSIPMNDWVEYAIGRLLEDVEDWNATLQNAFLDKHVQKMRISGDNDIFTLEKIYEH